MHFFSQPQIEDKAWGSTIFSNSQATTQDAAFNRYIHSSMIGPYWVCYEAAKMCVSKKLRTQFGGPVKVIIDNFFFFKTNELNTFRLLKLLKK